MHLKIAWCMIYRLILQVKLQSSRYHYLAGCRQLNYKCKSNHIRAAALPKLLQLDWWLKMTVGRGPSYLLSPPNCQHFPSSIPPPALHSPLHFTTPRLALSFIDIEGPLPTLC